MKRICTTIVFLLLLNFAFSQTTYYVNDNSIANDVFTSSIGSDTNPGTAALPFATIQHAADVAVEGSIIYVDAGVYFEQVTLSKGLSLFGVNSGVTIVWKPAVTNPPPGPFTEQGTIQSAQNIGDVNIRDMSVTGDGSLGVTPIILQTGGSVKNCRLINGSQGIFFRVDPAIKTAIIENNYINVQSIGINCQGSKLTAFLINNAIDLNNPFFAAGVFAGLDFGPLVQFTATGNSINNYNNAGFLANSYNTNITQNSIIGTAGFAIQQFSGNVSNATCNWYGTSDQYVVASKMNGNINFSPWLVNGTDNDPASIGFQPVPGSCAGRQLFYVNDNSLIGDIYTTAIGNNANSGSSSAPLATITAALAKVQVGDIILVDAGSYTEIVNVTKNITILGAGKGVTILNGPAGPVTPFPGTGETGIIQSVAGLTDVIVDNLTVDGTVSEEGHGIFIQGGGRVSNCELRYVNDGFYFQYISTQPRTAIGNNNYVHHINFVGSLFAGNGISATATNNVIDLNGAQYGIGFIAGYGGDGNVASFTASNNSIINFNGFGIMIGALQPAQIHNNSLTRVTGNYLQNQHTVNVDATCNWYGTIDATVIIPNMSGTIAYSPWLTSGTDNDVAIGFQPLANVCNGRQNKFYINDNSLTGDVFSTGVNPVGNDANPGIPSAPLLTLAAALTKAQPGDSIFVDAGTYVLSADLTIGKAVTILGTNYLLSPNDVNDKRVLNAVRNAESIVSNATLIIGSNDISIQGMVLDPGTGAIAVFLGSGTNYSNISLAKNRLKMNSLSPAVRFEGQGANTIAVSALVNSGFTIDDNRFEKYDAGQSLAINISRLKNVTVTNNAFVVGGSTLRNYTAIAMGNVGVIDAITFSSNTIDRALNAITGSRIGNAVLNGNKIYNTTNAFNISNTIPESSIIEFSNNLLDGSAGVSPFSFYTRGGGNAIGATNLFKAENNTVIGVAVLGTTTLLGTFNATFTNTVLSPSLVIRGNKISYSGDLSSVEGQFIRPIVIRGKLSNAIVENNELTLGGTNLRPGNPANVLPVCPAISLYSDNGSNSVIPAGAVINILNNKIQGFKYSFIVFDPTNAAGTGDSFTGFGNLGPNISVNVHDNSFTADSMSINNGSIGYPIDASCNWYGSTAVQDLVGKLSTELDNIYIPYLSNGTDNDPATGFQPVPGSCSGQPVQARLDGFTNVTCNGVNNGTASVTVFNGVAPFVFAWTKDGDPLFSSSVEDPTNFGPGTYHLTITDALGTNIILDANTDITTIDVTIIEPPLLTASAGGTNVSCFGGSNGSSNVTAGGGTLPYTYLWSNGGTNANISNVAAGIYSVTVTDGNGCTKSASYQVTQPTLLTAVATGTSTACANSATVVANGGTVPYSYSWSNGASIQSITSLPAGTYTVRVTDGHGCQTTASCTVSATEAFNPSASVTNVSCFGGNNGAITVTNVNGVSPFQFSINGVNFSAPSALPYTFSGLAAGTYTITVKDANGCTGFVDKTVAQSPLLVVAQSSVQNTCAGQSTGSITVTATGGSGSLVYSWTGPGGYTSTQKNISGLATGNYTLTVTDAKGCSKNLNINVPVNPVISVTEIITHVLCSGSATGSIDLTVTGGTGSGFTYLWNNGATTQDRINLAAGSNYKVTVTDISSGCSIQKTYAITQPASAVGITVSNPSIINVSGCNTLGSFTAQGSGGTQYPAPDPYRYSINGVYQTSPVFNNLQAGSYTVTVKDLNGCIATKAVTITDNGSDEYEGAPNNTGNNNNNAKGKAAPIGLGSAVSARIGIAGDLDYYKLGTANLWTGNYTIAFVQPATAVTFDLVASNGTTIIAPTSSSATAKQYNGLSGTYYVRASGTNSLSCYQFTVTSGIITRSSGSNIQPEVTKAQAKDGSFDVKVLGNPTSTSFIMNVITNSEEKISMRIFDGQGRLIEERQGLQPMETLRVGERYINGMYMAEIRQGKNIKTVRLVKL